MNGITGGLSRIRTTDGAASPPGAESPTTIVPNARVGDTLLGRNSQFERLVSGQETESGEAPPRYDVVART